jgi:hypothetical protein
MRMWRLSKMDMERKRGDGEEEMKIARLRKKDRRSYVEQETIRMFRVRQQKKKKREMVTMK